MRQSPLVMMFLGWPSAAIAGRQAFTEILDTELVPARGVEMLTAFDDRVGTPDGGADDETAVVWGVAFGLLHTLELTLSSEVAYAHADAATTLTWYAGAIRWRLRAAGPPPEPGTPVPVIHLLVERVIPDDLAEIRGDLTVGTDLTKGLHSAVMLGGLAVSTGDEAVLHGGIGLTGSATDSLRLGGEVFGELPIVPSGETFALSAGPAASFTRGQFWLTGGVLAGLGSTRPYDAKFHVAWGVEF